MKSFETRIHFDDCDPAGIVFFGNYYKLAHRALEQFCSSSSLGWEGWFRRPGVGVPLKHSEANYHAPIRSGSIIWIHVGIERMGTTSLTVKFDFRTGKDMSSELLAEVQTVHVFIDIKEKKPIPIPEDIRRALSS